METAVQANYKPMRYEGKGFLRNLNIRIHRILLVRCGLGWGSYSLKELLYSSELFIDLVKQFICQFSIKGF